MTFYPPAAVAPLVGVHPMPFHKRVPYTAGVTKGGTPKVPVGKGILSRMFNVFGNIIDCERRCPMYNGASLSPKSLKRGSKSSMYFFRWSVATRRDCLVGLESETRCSLPR